jgi:two-component system, cell cycle response regulator CpdR
MSARSIDTPLRVLFVEDNAYIRESVEILLRSPDREIISCESAEKAVAAFALRPFDVLITDVSLPNMSGTELARHILEFYPETWIVFCSGYALPGLTGLGPNVRSLPKPFDPVEMDRLLCNIRAGLLR